MTKSVQKILEEAEQRNMTPVSVALMSGIQNVNNPALWGDINVIDEDESESFSDLCAGRSDCLLADFNRSICNSIKFPEATGFLHGLGVIASAMTKAFKFEYFGIKKTVNLYTITAQPPSSGKSSINSSYTNPIIEAYQKINDSNRIKQSKINRELKKLKAELEKVPDSGFEQLESDILTKEKELADYPIYQPFVTDGTNEGIRDSASRQGGMFNIVSAESDAINIILGNTYGDGKKNNNSMFLSGWDDEAVSIVRAGSEPIFMKVRASMAIIAQDESIDSLLQKGLDGLGISERVLILKEPSKMGTRDFTKYVPRDKELTLDYAELIQNIIKEYSVTIKLSSECMGILNDYRNTVEPNLSNNGKYSHPILRGFIGKLDKHILKIATVLHVIEQWSPGANKEKTLDEKHLLSAIGIFEQLAKGYIKACDALGYVGKNTEIEEVKRIFESKKKGAIIKIPDLVRSIKNLKAFKGSGSPTKKIRDEILPSLELINYCAVHDNKVYINPKLKG